MLSPIFTLDYEIHGNGDGCPAALMLEPTDRLLQLFDEFGAKLTIMADVAEILKFKHYLKEVGRDDFYSKEIERQLQDAIRRGHDVQLHIHSSYFGAHCHNGRWVQDWTEYDFARLPVERMDWMVKQGKTYLESLLKPIDPGYQCDVFRAANWSVSPSENVVKTLEKNGIRIDTSIFKYGRRSGRVQFDYSSATSELLPWRVKADDICAQSDKGLLWEFPIYSELRSIAAFATANRVRRAVIGRGHRLPQEAKNCDREQVHGSTNRPNMLEKVLGLHAWKADFNQCTGRQLISAIKRAEKQFDHISAPLPFVLIGHSKLFSHYNARSLRPLLSYIERQPNRFKFGKFSNFRVTDYMQQEQTNQLAHTP